MSTFMSLPVEIRSQILKDALIQTDPVRIDVNSFKTAVVPDKNFSFAATILTTCSQLYQEGVDYLYHHNIFELNIAKDTRNLNKCPSSVLSKGQKFHIIFHCEPHDESQHNSAPYSESGVIYRHRKVVHQLCSTLIETVRTPQSLMWVDFQYSNHVYNQHNRKELHLSLNLFKLFLRGFHDARVTGVNSNYAEELEQAMMSTSPANNMWKMIAAFYRWQNNVSSDEGYHLGNCAIDCFNGCDTAEYKEVRDTIVGAIEGPPDQKKALSILFQYDLD